MKKKAEIIERIALLKKYMKDKRVTKTIRNKREFGIMYLEWVLDKK